MITEGQFDEWCRSNGGETARGAEGSHRCIMNRDDSINFVPGEGLDVMAPHGQVISESASLPDGVRGNRIVAEEARDGPDRPVQDFVIEVSGSYPDGTVRIR